ncbi:uncharacterized protein TNCV_4593751 [Trichonephila clavipes]|uniref:Mutator-like transposase domain-containing protein n=1 Tax=Trichonephila clavipes TaxID=2585209 RepID=A0A8X7BJP7_TRICX|nr:uncharacterized protein TNCV_4593751 [Trichonephila clavipes]
MEVAGALSIFQRSQSLYNVRYTKYLGDGDSKAFTSIVENKVYGDHCSVEKLECIGHVMKRMGTRLRRLKTKMRGQKLSDGKPLCGRNRLTEAEIDRLQAYYGLAIRRNLSSVKDMQQAIWAIFLHKLSTDEKPQHGFCPSDSDTWCKFKKAELLGETYHHKNSLPVDVVEAMRPVFRDLANPELLKKSVYMENEQLSDLEKGHVVGPREADWSNRRIGRRLGRSDMVVVRCWQQWIKEQVVLIGIFTTSGKLESDQLGSNELGTVMNWAAIFSNESRFSLNADYQCIRVWKRPGH